MNQKSMVMTGLAVFAAVFGVEFLIHGVLLHGIYQQTPWLWRPQAEMRYFMPFMTAGQFIFAVVFTALFARVYEEGRNGLGQGFRYGLWMGALFSPANALMWYAILPISKRLAVCWLGLGFVEMIVLGLVAGLVYRSL